MEGTEKGENSENESPPLRVDPRCIQDALRSFLQPIKTDDPHQDFYTMYKREATEHDTDYVKKYDEDLNTTLIFAGLFSAVSSAFVIDVHSKLQSDPNDQSIALLRAILLTLNQSAIPGETPAAPLVQGDPPSEIVTVTGLMYASLLISLLAAFVAMLGKQWLNRYLRNAGGSMIERCGDRQRKCDGLERWPFHLIIESLPVMLQVALLLLACGLCRHMWSINTPITYILITFTGLGVLFYLAIVIAGTSSYACPFQTPASTTLRSSWKKLRRGVVSLTAHSKQALLWIRRVWKRSVVVLLRSQPPPMIPLENIQVQQPEPWLEPKDLATIRRTNTNDAGCVSWILRNITDSEALDAAVRLAGTIRWFEGGTDLEPPYDLIISTFRTCFDSNGNVYPGSRDRAYYSGRALVWMRTLATCKSRETARRLPPFDSGYTAPAADRDLTHLLTINKSWNSYSRFLHLLDIDPGHTPSHSQWISNVLLHHSWAYRASLDFDWIQEHISSVGKTVVPPDVMFNRLLVWCIFLDSPVEKEALRVQDKFDRLQRILRQLSKAIVQAINETHPRHHFIPHVLRDLVKLGSRPQCLAEMAYEWCSVICENQSFEDQESLLLDCLEIGFRHLGLQDPWVGDSHLIHTGYHRGLAGVVFESKDGEAIADLLLAWTVKTRYNGLVRGLLGTCTGHLVRLYDLAPFSSRLRLLVIRSVGLIGYKGFEEVGVGKFVELLNHLRVGVKDVEYISKWISLLLDTIRSPEGVRYLSDQSWELLAELATSEPAEARPVAYNPHVMPSLFEVQEWNKLECWIGVIWMKWPPETEETTEDLERVMVSLFRHRPGAAQKLAQWVEQRSERRRIDVPRTFERICKRAHKAAQQDLPLTSSTSDGTEGPTRSPLLAPPPSSGGSTFWASLPYRVL